MRVTVTETRTQEEYCGTNEDIVDCTRDETVDVKEDIC